MSYYTLIAEIATPKGTLLLSRATADPDWYLIEYDVRDGAVLDVTIEDARCCQGHLAPGEWAYFGRQFEANLRPASCPANIAEAPQLFTL